jgi:hypothetical protein
MRAGWLLLYAGIGLISPAPLRTPRHGLWRYCFRWHTSLGLGVKIKAFRALILGSPPLVFAHRCPLSSCAAWRSGDMSAPMKVTRKHGSTVKAA